MLIVPMAIEISSLQRNFLILQTLLSVLPLLISARQLQFNHGCSESDSSSPFPPNFLFGVASSAYQVQHTLYNFRFPLLEEKEA